MVKIRLGANNNYKLLQYLSKLLEIPKTACVFESENAFFQSAISSVIKYRRLGLLWNQNVIFSLFFVPYHYQLNCGCYKN